MRVSAILFFLLLVGMLNAYVVVNSHEGIDVTSAIYYAHTSGEEYFYVTPGSDMVLTARQIGNRDEVTLMEAANNPMFAGFKSALEAQGNTVSVLTSTNPLEFNLRLAGDSGAKNFIITDPNYGYNVASVVAYAKAKGAYLIFATRENADSVVLFLSTASPSSVLLYGFIDEEIPSALDENGISYEQINTGDKYEDNIEILKKYFQLVPDCNQVTFTDGTFLEPTIDSGEYPVVLVSTVVPNSMRSFMLEEVRGGQVKVGVLVGNQLIDPVYDLMKYINEELGEKRFSVFVKFGQASSASSGLQVLSTFPLPTAYAEVSLDSATYNTASGAIELVFSNKGNAVAFVKSTVPVLINGKPYTTVGDEEPYTIRREGKQGVRYPLSVEEGKIAINITVYYGTTRNFDKGFIQYLDVGRVDYIDQSMLAIESAAYTVSEDTLSVKVWNNGSEDVYYRLSVTYSNEGGATSFDDEKVRSLQTGKSEVIQLGGFLIAEEDAPSTLMNITAVYGSREAFMEKEATAPVEVKVGGFGELLGNPLPWLLLLIIILVLAYVYFKKGEKGGKGKAAEEKEVVRLSSIFCFL